MYILGISCYYHDAAAVLLNDGVLVAAAEEERFTRKKHDFDFPKQAIQFLPGPGRHHGQRLSTTSSSSRSHSVNSIASLMMTLCRPIRSRTRSLRESMITWMVDKLWVGTKIETEIGVSKDKILFSEHHLSHAASAYFCSPFEESAILTVDGVGEWVTSTYGVGKGNDIKIQKEIHFPHSLGLLYSAFTAFLGFEVNEGEYKVMGMAPYGEPKYVDKVWKLINQNSDGSFSLNMDYFSFHHSTERTYNQKFADLFGTPRPEKMLFFTEETGFPKYFGAPPGNMAELSKMNKHYADIAASIQKVTEDVLVNMAKHLHKTTGMKNLCMAGVLR